jgi:hypothetical protein
MRLAEKFDWKGLLEMYSNCIIIYNAGMHA